MTATTTAAKTTCDGTPVVTNGGDHSNCTGLRNGAICVMRCQEGFTKDVSASDILCSGGAWKVPGACLVLGAKVRRVRAIQVAMQLGSVLPKGTSSGGTVVSITWALAHKALILTAVSITIGYDPSNVQIDIVQIVIKRSGRRLSSGDAWAEGEFDRNLQATNDMAGSDFEVRVTVLTNETSNASVSTLANDIHASLAGTSTAPGSGTSGGFLANLVATVQEAGLEAPAGLAVLGTTPPVVVENYAVAVAQWLAGGWNPCSAVCGQGTAARPVQCSTGEDLNCQADAGVRPVAEAVCVDFTGCAFDATCPFGHGKDLSCTGQRVLVAVIVSIASAGCFALLFWRLRRGCRAPQDGSVNLGIGADRLHASWRIYKPGKSDAGTGDDGEANAITKDGKTHVVWDVEAPDVQKWMANQGKQMHIAQGSADSLPRLPRVSSASRMEEDDDALERQIDSLAHFCATGLDEAESQALGPRLSLWRRNSRLSGLSLEAVLVNSSPATGPILKTAYADGERVEYFSKTLGRWLFGLVHVATRKGDQQTQMSTRYDVELIPSAQQRLDVGLAALRLPFKLGEPVELYARRHGGEWLPGAIAAPLPTTGAVPAYRVELDGARAALEGVAALRLRRRFLVGDVVEVFCGPASGWCPAEVEALFADCPADACLALPPFVEGEGADDDDLESPVSRGSARTSTSRLSRPRSRANTLASTLFPESELDEPGKGTPSSVATRAAWEPWTWIALAVIETRTGPAKREAEWFPTFLVR